MLKKLNCSNLFSTFPCSSVTMMLDIELLFGAPPKKSGLATSCTRKSPVPGMAAGRERRQGPGAASPASRRPDWLSAPEKICGGGGGGGQVPPAVPVATGLSTLNVSVWVAGLKSS